MGKIDFVPNNESAVRDWFAANLDKFDYDIVVSKGSFPDYVLRDKSGKQHKVEAEYVSRNFIDHKHDPRGCDFVLCWIHNEKLPVEVFELTTGKMYEANAEPPDITPEEMDHRKEKEQEAFGSFSKAVNASRETISHFVLAIAKDLKVQSQYSQIIKESRLELMSITRELTMILESNGFNCSGADPYDLFDMILKVPKDQD